MMEESSMEDVLISDASAKTTASNEPNAMQENEVETKHLEESASSVNGYASETGQPGKESLSSLQTESDIPSKEETTNLYEQEQR